MAVHAPVAVALTVPPFKSITSASPLAAKSVMVKAPAATVKVSSPAPPVMVESPDVLVKASTAPEPVIALVPVLTKV